MKKMIMVFGVLSSFITPLGACENENKAEDKIIFTVGLQEEVPKLTYCGSKKIEAVKKYFPDIRDNEPFFIISDYASNTQRAKCSMHEGCVLNNDHIGKIRDFLENNLKYLPLRYFLSEQEKFKSNGDELCSCECTQNISELYVDVAIQHKYRVLIKLNSSQLSQYAVKGVMNEFCSYPNCLLEDKQELINAGIIGRQDVERIHGINSYFADEIKTVLFYSRLKKLLFGGSIAAIIVYALYKKFYTTS